MNYSVPGVYYEPSPRAAEVPVARTDVGGFIGFEPRVRDGTTPSTSAGYRVDVGEFQLLIGSVQTRVAARVDFPLTPKVVLAVGQTVRYALVAVGSGAASSLISVPGTPAGDGGETAPTDSDIDAAVLPPGTPWVRIADVAVRSVIGTVVAVTVHPAPALALTRCDDYGDYTLAFGVPPDDGLLLGLSVRAYFANGGRRCWVTTVRRPDFSDAVERERARLDMVGVPGSSEVESTGLERLLLEPQVTFIDVPDLYARRVDQTTTTIPLPPRDVDACFRPCTDMLPKGVASASSAVPSWDTIYDASAIFQPDSSKPHFDAVGSEVFWTQRDLLARCIQERWRALLLLSVPLRRNPSSGLIEPPGVSDADLWRSQFHALVTFTGFAETDAMAAGALYWPWVYAQDKVDSPVMTMPPSPYAAGIIARRDIARGPSISPANETLTQVVGLTVPATDDDNGRLYIPGPDASGFDVEAVNVIRSFPGLGVQIWGSRTLSVEEWLRYMAVRRTLTAIEVQMKLLLDQLVFEPNTPVLWMHMTQVALGVLMPLWEQGVLRGTSPVEAFYVRCDDSVNPPEAIAQGQVLMEVGVAVAAPAEFIVFRLGRKEGVTEVLE